VALLVGQSGVPQGPAGAMFIEITLISFMTIKYWGWEYSGMFIGVYW